ncbi:MAG: protein kinase [Acidobacteria bacterium]|nr:protein kinase [Acidobacteriota bacterium]
MPEPGLSLPPGPPEQLGPYRVLERLGEGGMGVVYLAFDVELGRRVALKWLKHGNPAMVERLLQEAQLHARVEHPNVCRLYHAGEHQGAPYLVLQLVRGETLDQVAPRLSLDAKLRLMVAIADGVQAAHRQGLIHRDLKPGNLMVEPDEAGGWRPYVMDFGLARDDASGTLTMAGTLLGSPAYMAPEQIAGGWVDPRTDVYGLGASLFECLTGRPPFQGQTLPEVLHKVQTERLPALRSLCPGLPGDLEVILACATAKDPGSRYPSAAAFRDDLQRLLDGEPIRARRASLPQRIRLWVRRNPRLAAVSAAGAAGVLLLGGLWARAERGSAERARFSRQFGEQVAALEQIGRISALLPLHDTRAERLEIRQRMDRIRADLDRAGSAGAGPGHYALGRGYLTLGEDAQARRHLERSWKAGSRDPDTAASLGLVLGRLYQKELSGLGAIDRKDLRELRLKEIELAFRDPALAFLRQARGARTESPHLLEGRIAAYEKRFDEARALARRTLQEQPWSYEARRLEAETFLAQARTATDTGDWGEALKASEQAGASLAAGLEIARSDTGLHDAESARRLLVLESEIPQGRFLEARVDWVLEGCNAALQADPGSLRALETKAMLFARLGQHQASHGVDPGPAFHRSREAAETALQLHPDATGPCITIGFACWQEAEHQKGKGQDPRPTARAGIAALSRAAELDPGNSVPLSYAGVIERAVGDFEYHHGEDPRPALARASAHLEKAVALNPRNTAALNNLSLVHYSRGRYEGRHGRDPVPDFRTAIARLEASITINPRLSPVFNNLGAIRHELASHLYKVGLSWEVDLDLALESFRRAAELNPQNPSPRYNLAFTLHNKAEWLLDGKGADPTALLEDARRAIRAALDLKPDDAENHLEAAQISRILGRWALRQGRSPQALFDAADQDLERGVRLNPQDASLRTGQAEVAMARLEGPVAPATRKRILGQALAAAEKALAISPESLQAQGLRGRALLGLAEIDPTPPSRRARATQALAAFETSIRQDSKSLGSFRDDLERARRLVKGEGTFR